MVNEVRLHCFIDDFRPWPCDALLRNSAQAERGSLSDACILDRRHQV